MDNTKPRIAYVNSPKDNVHWSPYRQGYKQSRIVELVTPDNMDGDSVLERQVNALLTTSFILSSGVPADECLSEARHIIKNWLSRNDINDYLYSQFGHGEPKLVYKTVAGEVYNLLNLGYIK